jgi:dTDP-4-dehydrorhamnose reductase
MKLLIIGAKGQLARSLAEVAVSKQVVARCIGRPELDLLEPESIERAIAQVGPCTVIINAGAYTAVDKAEEDCDLAYSINRDGARHVAEACAARNRPLIHISTDYVFDGIKTQPKRESDPARPINVYGLSKLEGERSVAAVAAQHVILRTSWIYSPFGNNFVKTMLRLAESNPQLAIVDDQIGNPTYAPHLAAGILQIARRIKQNNGDALPWGIYHLSGTGEASWYQLARKVLECSANLGGPVAQISPISTNQCPTRAQRPADSRLDCSKCAETFGVTLPDWRCAIEDCVARLLENVD